MSLVTFFRNLNFDDCDSCAAVLCVLIPIGHCFGDQCARVAHDQACEGVVAAWGIVRVRNVEVHYANAEGVVREPGRLLAHPEFVLGCVARGGPSSITVIAQATSAMQS